MAHPHDAQPVAPPPAARLDRTSGAVGLVASLSWVLWRPPVSTGPVRVPLTIPQGLALNAGSGSRSLAISPDGRSVAFVTTSAGNTQIYLRVGVSRD